MANVRIIENAPDLAIAHWIEARLVAALAGTVGPIAISVPGGQTPFPILRLLAAMRLAWERIVVWPGDEREVPPDHPASNRGRIAEALAGSGATIAALESKANPPHFALTWLGMGDDGHVASLFPSSDPRADDRLAVRRIIPEPLPPEAPFARLSLTIPALLNADAVVFVIRGAEKRAVFEAAMRGDNDLPVARLLRAASQEVTCFT